MKKILGIFIIGLLLSSTIFSGFTSFADSSDIKVKVNGNQVSFDVPPTSINGRTLVPLRAIFEALGATVDWDNSTNTITGTKGGIKIILKLNSSEATVNGEQKTLDVPATSINGRTLVPVRFISESLGCQVNWDDTQNTVNIMSQVKVFFNEVDSTSNCVPLNHNGEVYLPINPICKNYNISIMWNAKNGGFIFNDQFTNKSIYVKANTNSISYFQFHELKFDANGYLTIVTENEGIIQINEPCIFDNKESYVSLNFLNKILGFDVNSSGDIVLKRQINPTGFEDYLKSVCVKTYETYNYPKDTLDTTYKDILDTFMGYDDYHYYNIDKMFKTLDNYSKIQAYFSKTVWIKKSLFGSMLNDGKVNITNSDTNELLSKDSLGYYVKVQVVDADESGNVNVIVNYLKCKISSDIILDAKEENYEIFEKDPKTVFNWSDDTWNKFNNGDEYWIGMTTEMAIMTIRRPDKINRSTGSWGTDEQWVYSDSNGIGWLYLYFENDVLTSWQD